MENREFWDKVTTELSKKAKEREAGKMPFSVKILAIFWFGIAVLLTVLPALIDPESHLNWDSANRTEQDCSIGQGDSK